ncbi:MAG: hypothetical protein V4649_01580 [Bacteroidota bacterium]
MKNDKRQQAKSLWFQSGLNKTEIAKRLGVNRRTVMLWVQEGNWDRLRTSAQHMPAMVTEKCYMLLDHYATHLMTSNAEISTFGPRQANAINAMATSIKKLRTRAATNEAMEMFNYFIEYVRRTDPEMLEFVIPLAEGYIKSREDVEASAFMPAGFDHYGFSIHPEKEILEKWADEDECKLMEKEYRLAREQEESKQQGEREDTEKPLHKHDATPPSPSILGLPNQEKTYDAGHNMGHITSPSPLERAGERCPISTRLEDLPAEELAKACNIDEPTEIPKPTNTNHMNQKTPPSVNTENNTGMKDNAGINNNPAYIAADNEARGSIASLSPAMVSQPNHEKTHDTGHNMSHIMPPSPVMVSLPNQENSNDASRNTGHITSPSPVMVSLPNQENSNDASRNTGRITSPSPLERAGERSHATPNQQDEEEREWTYEDFLAREKEEEYWIAESQKILENVKKMLESDERDYEITIDEEPSRQYTEKETKQIFEESRKMLETYKNRPIDRDPRIPA